MESGVTKAPESERIKPELDEKEERIEVPFEDEFSGQEYPAGETTDDSGSEDDVGALFDALRGGGHVPEPPPAGEEQSEVESETKSQETQPEEDTSRDWIEVRDSRLLPITNRALRGTKKALTELQNIALDGLRTDENWRPDVDAIYEALQAELKALWAESFAAGHVVAEEMTGSKIKRPPTPPASTLPQFAKALADSVGSTLDNAENGQRARQAAASRVFRVWRTDEAERRIRELAIHSYELGVELSVEVETPVG